MTKSKSPKKINDDLLELFELLAEIICQLIYLREYRYEILGELSEEDMDAKKYIKEFKNDLKIISCDGSSLFLKYPNMTYKQRALLFPGIYIRRRKAVINLFKEAHKDNTKIGFRLFKKGQEDIVIYRDLSTEKIEDLHEKHD